MPPCILRIPKDSAHRTAEITANVWFEFTLSKARGPTWTHSGLAREMVENGRSLGLNHAAMNARIQKDLDRIDTLERLSLWTRFDPDHDLLGKGLHELSAKEIDFDDDDQIASILRSLNADPI
jgi:hypothetical protein